MTRQERCVMAFDPGYDRLGVAVVAGTIQQPNLLFADTLRTPKTTPHDARLCSLGERVAALLASYRPTCCAVETLFFQKNRKTALAVAEMRGIIRYEIARAGIPLRELSPQAVKIAVTSYGNASKDAVARMVLRFFPNAVSLGDDAIDAVALAVAALASPLSAYPHL